MCANEKVGLALARKTKDSRNEIFSFKEARKKYCVKGIATGKTPK